MLLSMGVRWHPIFNDDLSFRIMPSDWLEPCYCGPAPTSGHPANHALNWFLDHNQLGPSCRYLILADDDFYEPEFFSKVDRHDGDLLVCSMNRGQHQPASGPQHGTSPLIAAQENLVVCKVGCEQLIISGARLQDLRFSSGPTADGILIEELARHHKFEFVPEAEVLFNALEPGRWDHVPGW